jgi:molybdopterin-guanine dinucleotide biosynthesis protein MobB
VRSLGVVLAGGASRRFGSTKALATVGGVPLLQRVRSALEAVPLPVVVIGPAEVARVAGLPFREDLRPGAGPLGGLEAALVLAAERELRGVALVGCDMPFLAPRLIRRLVEEGEAHGVPAVVPVTGEGASLQPLCAWYSTALIPTVSTMLDAGERSMTRLVRATDATLLSPAEVERLCDPGRSFLNVNTIAEHRTAEQMARVSDPLRENAPPPVISIVGRKNSGKTTFLVALAAELGRRGLRVASMKHGHHHFEIDQPGRDSWRHFHEGGAEAVLIVAQGRVAMVSRHEGDPDPRELIRRHLSHGGYDIILAEGYKHGPFEKIEVHRSELHPRPLACDVPAAGAGPTIALVSDGTDAPAGPIRIPWSADLAHVVVAADLLEGSVLRRTDIDG